MLIVLAGCIPRHHGVRHTVHGDDFVQKPAEDFVTALDRFAQPWAFNEGCTYVHVHPGAGVVVSNPRVLPAPDVKLPQAGEPIRLARVWDEEISRNRLLLIAGSGPRHFWLDVDCRKNQVSIQTLPSDAVPPTFEWSPSTTAYFYREGRFLSLSSCSDATSGLCINGRTTDSATAPESAGGIPQIQYSLRRPVAAIISPAITAVLTDHDGQAAMGFVDDAWDTEGRAIATLPLDATQFAGSMSGAEGVRCRVRFVPSTSIGPWVVYMAYCHDDSGTANLVVGRFGFNETGSMAPLGRPWEKRGTLSTGDPLLSLLVHPEAMAASNAKAQWIVAQHLPEVGWATIGCFDVHSRPIISAIHVASPLALHLIRDQLTVVDMHGRRTFSCEQGQTRP